MNPILWHLVRDDFHELKNTVRGFVTWVGEGNEGLVLQTVENLTRRIPPGVYDCVRDYYHGGGYPAFEIIWPHDEDGDGEPDRDRLLVHAANAVRNRGGELSLLGCIAPGLSRVDDTWETFYPDDVEKLPARARNLPGVTSSKTALERFMAPNPDRFRLRVTE